MQQSRKLTNLATEHHPRTVGSAVTFDSRASPWARHQSLGSATTSARLRYNHYMARLGLAAERPDLPGLPRQLSFAGAPCRRVHWH